MDGDRYRDGDGWWVVSDECLEAGGWGSDQKFYLPEISLLELAASFREISADYFGIPPSRIYRLLLAIRYKYPILSPK